MLHDKNKTRLIRTAELQNPTSHLAKVKALAKNLDTWFESLDAPTKEALQSLYESAKFNLDNAMSDISALTAAYMNAIAKALAEEKEGLK